MLGCFVGAGETAARGVPARFVGKEKEKSEEVPETKEPATSDKSAADKSEPSKNAAASGTLAEPMEVDS